MRRNQKNVTEDDFIMLPTVDFCFKELMQNENIRKGIVAALLKLHPERRRKKQTSCLQYYKNSMRMINTEFWMFG